MITAAILALSLFAPPSPLQCAEPTAAKGDVKCGPPLVHVFELRHAGMAGLLTITNIEAGCGCLRRHLSATVLKPGDAAQLTVEVNTLTQPEGPNRWGLRISYRLDDGPATGALDLAISGKVVREISLAPPQLALSTTGEVVRTLTLTDRRLKPLTLTRAESTSPHLTATIAPRRDAETTITLTLAAAAPAGVRDEAVVLYSDDPEYPEFRVPVRVEKRAAGAAVVVPDAVALRFAAGEKAASALVQVRNPAGKDVAIEKVESDHPSVTAKSSTTRGPVAAIRVMVAAGSAGRTDLRIHLAEPPGQLVILPVSWTSQR